MQRFIQRHPVWSFIIALGAAILLWLIFAPWSAGMEETLGKKRVFLNGIFGGITLGALYFLVASGFTLIFGLMRNVNLAHGSLYLLGGYLGFEISEATGSWLLAFPVVFILVAALGLLLQHQVFRRMEGEELRQTMVTIGWSYSTGSAFDTRIASIRPERSAFTSFIIFIDSMIQRVSPSLTRSPTSTNGGDSGDGAR